MGYLHKNIQLMLEFRQGPFLVLYLSYYTLMTFPVFSVILISMLMILLCTLNVIRHDLWQQLELASEFKSDLRDTMNRGRKWLVDFNAGKTQLVSFDQTYDVKMDGSVLQAKSSLKMLELTFSSKLNWSS